MVALAINVGLLVAEAVGGFLTGSLALLADAGHVLSDVGAIALGLFAAAIAARGRRPRAATFGFSAPRCSRRSLNGVALVAIAVWIAIAAIGRLSDPPGRRRRRRARARRRRPRRQPRRDLVLARGERDDINLEGVLRHSAADALGSVGVIVSGTVILVDRLAASGPARQPPDRRPDPRLVLAPDQASRSTC